MCIRLSNWVRTIILFSGQLSCWRSMGCIVGFKHAFLNRLFKLQLVGPRGGNGEQEIAAAARFGWDLAIWRSSPFPCLFLQNYRPSTNISNIDRPRSGIQGPSCSCLGIGPWVKTWQVTKTEKRQDQNDQIKDKWWKIRHVHRNFRQKF